MFEKFYEYLASKSINGGYIVTTKHPGDLVFNDYITVEISKDGAWYMSYKIIFANGCIHIHNFWLYDMVENTPADTNHVVSYELVSIAQFDSIWDALMAYFDFMHISVSELGM